MTDSKVPFALRWLRPVAVALRSHGGFWRRCATVLVYIGAGFLDRKSLRSEITAFWDCVESRRPPEGQDLFSWEQGCYSRALRPAESVLVVGCGRGRDLLALRRRGHPVEGVELSSDKAIAAARLLTTHGFESVVHAGDILITPLSGAWNVVTLSYCTYAYLAGSETRVGLLKRLSTHLLPGGRIVVAVHADMIPRHPFLGAMARTIQAIRQCDWRMEPGDSFVWRGGPLSFVHRFAAGEVEREAVAAGFEIADHERSTEAEVFVLRKRD